MYKDFYNLKEYPFGLTPDPKFVVFTPSNNELLAGLYYGVEMSKGLVLLTGEVGTGKTTAIRWLIRRLDTTVSAAYIFNPRLSVDELYHRLAEMLEITKWENKTDLLAQMGKVLEERTSRGLKTLLIIDEAHALTDDVLEEVRLLLNFESDNAKYLQVILVGQPELKARLRQHNLRQLKQRVAVRCSMPPLASTAEVGRYISERLEIAGAKKTDIFEEDAVEFISYCSGGIPRIINNLCDNSLIIGFSADSPRVTKGMVELAADNLDLLPDRDTLLPSERTFSIPSGSVLTSEGKEDLLEATSHRKISDLES